MDSLGEVGKKMRSAIKAKLVELGNASSTGYIDDELPDYVMIMVANKRPKQQMLVDLNLFLGSNTETFVNWLHQVLQKLQEVTLPTNLATKAKKKISESSSKKDKKKDKKKHPKEPSITDVIAVELMEKAKKTIDPKVKCEKTEKSRTPSPPPAPLINNSSSERIDKQPQTAVSSSEPRSSNKSDDDLNIPTLSEIRLNKSNSSNLLHKKELGDLQSTEKKIQELKRNRRAISGPESNNKQKDKELSDEDEEMHEEASPENNTSQKDKGGVKSRLGAKPTEVTNNSKSGNIISLSAIRRSETEFLKKIVVKQKEDNERKVDDYRSVRNNRHDSNASRNYGRRERRSRSNSRDRHRNRTDRVDRFRRRSRSRSPIKSHDSRSRLSIRDRIGDKIQSSATTSSIINRKHSKTPEGPDGNFKVKSRPALSSTISSHAGKSMLLRAMADAQRSTQASSDAKKRQRENITVQVKNEKRNQSHLNDEEYVPESISGHSESEAEYHPSYVKNQDGGEDDEDVIYLNNNDDVDLDDLDDNNEMPKPSPKFIVTLDNKDLGTVNRDKSKSHSPTPPKVIKRNKRTPVKDRIGDRVSNNRNSERTNKEYEHRPRKRQHQEPEMEVEESEAQRAYNKVKKTRVSPIKFDLTDEEDGRISRSSSRDPSEKKSSISKNDSDHNGEEHTKRIKLEASRSFDHVPALLSSIAVPVPESSKPVVTKSKDRCKFYPNCSNTNCIYYHPTLPCKAFPNCKFGDSCAYTHPPCKFDKSCHRGDCNYTHSVAILPATTPVIASSIVPVQNYKSITLTPTMQLCKFFPNCTNTNCIYQHPKVCKFGKACANKFECNFYHFETASKSKFRWVSSAS
ncbi:zinc finger CCCH domain-containing protein 14 [Chironomus tepperi]|uniref:zinc finger CCCH domain-containing protein 14 n=1 Tax=Chironomus tepperi TaxID=113505 RepID=UPI00391F9EBD